MPAVDNRGINLRLQRLEFIRNRLGVRGELLQARPGRLRIGPSLSDQVCTRTKERSETVQVRVLIEFARDLLVEDLRVLGDQATEVGEVLEIED